MAFAHIGSLGRGFGRMSTWLGTLIEAPYEIVLNFAEARNSQYIVVMGI
jgi:hypothetical protein